MFETASDSSEHINSHDTTQESETDMQLLAESQGLLLREQNDQLFKENSSLRAQFEEALKITKQVEEVHLKNRQLKSEIRDYQAKIDNVNQRVEISTKTIEELNQKLEEEKLSSHAARENDQLANQKEIQKIKAQNKAQLDDLYGQLDKLNELKEKDDMGHKLQSNKIERCLDNAQHFFQVNFQSFDDFISFLSQTPVSQPTQDAQLQQQQQQQQLAKQQQTGNASIEQIQKLGKRLKRERQKLKEQASAQEELEATINKLKRDQQDIDNKHKQEITTLKKEFELKEEDLNLTIADQKHQISALAAKVESLKVENAKRKATAEQNAAKSVAPPPQIIIQAPQPQKAQPNQPEPQNNQSQEYDLAVEQMTQRNDELSRQLKNVTSQRDDLASKVRELESQKHEIDIALGKSKSELNALSIVHNETCIELESIRKALHEKESSIDRKEKAKLKRELQSTKAQITSLQSTVDSQKKQSYELTLSNEQANNTIAQLNQKVSEYKKAAEEDKRTIDSLRDDISTVQQQYNEKPTLTPEDVMPPNVWKFVEFGSELSDQISKIAMNPSFQPASKLQNIYKAILGYYSQIIKERDLALNESYSENQQIKHVMHQLLINVSIALSLEPITLDEFFKRNGTDQIVSAINQLRNTGDDYKRSSEHLNNVINHFCKTMNLSSDFDVNSVVQQANRVKEQLNSQTALLQRRSKKYQEISTAFKGLKRKYENDVEDLNAQLSHLNESVDQLTKTNTDLASANQKYKRELQAIKSEFRDFKEKKDENDASLNEKHEEDQQAWNKEKSELEAQIQELIKTSNDKNNTASDVISENESTIERLKTTVKAQKATISERDQELTNLKKTLEDTIQDLTSRADKEKKQLIHSYEKAVSEITEQCNSHRSDVEKMAKVVSEKEKKIKQAKTSIMQAKREAMRLNTELQSQKEQNERDRKLLESTSKSSILNAETNFNTRLDEQKSRFETEKRRIYAFVADTFKQFFNPNENIDEKSFKSIVTRTRDELAQLFASDLAIRRLVGASSHQKTDDAVAQVLMSNA